MSKMSKTIAVLGVVAGLGVAALPLSTYAANPETVNLNVKVIDKIELTASESTVSINATNGNAVTGQEGTVDLTVETGNSKGYKLSAKTGNVNLTNTDSDTIPAGAPITGSSFWGMKGGNQTFATYAGLTTTDQTVKNTTAAPTSGTDTVTVTFGVTTSASQNAGTYTGNAIFTATANI